MSGLTKQKGHFYEFGPYQLLPDDHLLLRDGEPVALTPKAFETLVALVARAGRLVEKEGLLNEVWAGTYVEESNIAQNVFALRRVLGRTEEGAPYIVTVPKRGYRFSASVKIIEDRGNVLLVPQSVTENGDESPSVGSRAAKSSLPESTIALRQTTATMLRRMPVGQLTQSTARPGLKAAWLIVLIGIAPALVGLGLVIARLFIPASSSPAMVPKLSRLLSGERIWSAAISPDGRHVAHVVQNAGQMSIWVRQVATTTDLNIIPATHGAYWGLTFSRDGDYLYYVRHLPDDPFASVYRVSMLGGVPRKIVADTSSPITISPSGKQIAFIRNRPGESILIIADADGTNEHGLAVRKIPFEFFSSSPRGGPSWSPDGRAIATGVISLKGGYHGELIAISVGDGSERQLTARRWYQVAQVAWLSDGSGLLVAGRESSGTQIWHVSYSDGAVRKVTNDLNDYHGVSLTSDSRTLCTVQYDRSSSIEFVPEKPPSAAKRNTAGMNEGFYGLSWSPDGKLVYASEAAGNLDLWLMEPDGVTVQQLTTDSHHDSSPSVSPDGSSIVFVSYRNGDIPHIWRMDIDGRNQRQLTNHAFEGSPSFTPDGRWVVYAVAGSGIWKLPAAGGEPVRISGADTHTPSVSPDGSLVACAYRNDEPNSTDKIAVLPIDGGAPVKIFDEPDGLSSSAIRWTADGRALVYVATHNDISNLWTLPLDGSPPRPATSFTSDLIFNFAWSRDYKQLTLAQGNTAEHVVLIGNIR